MFSAQVEEGLELRLLEVRHAEALFSLIDQNREHLSYWFPFMEKMEAVEDARRNIREGLEQFSKGKGFELGIWFNETLVGAVGAHNISQRFNCAEVGYWLEETRQGRGITTKVCAYICTHLFDELDLDRVEISCSERNTRSRKIPERLGFTLEGKLRQMGYTEDGLTDYLVYGLLKSEWQKGKETNSPPLA